MKGDEGEDRQTINSRQENSKTQSEDYLEVPQRHQNKDNLPSRYFCFKEQESMHVLGKISIINGYHLLKKLALKLVSFSYLEKYI